MHSQITQLFRRLPRWKKRVASRDRAAITAGLQDQKKLLLSAMKAAEDGFLLLGRQMQGMSTMANTIARLATDVLEATSGTGEKGALCQATRTVEMVFARAEQKQSHYARILARLRDISSRTGAILSTQEELTRALFPFRPLAMGFRVETARLGEGDSSRFLALAESITKAHAHAQSSVDQYFVELADIRMVIEEMQARLVEFFERSTKELSRTKLSLEEHLFSLRIRWSSAAKASAAADEAVRDIIAQIGRIIIATQYQDITRQQIEHICGALDEIRNEFDDAGQARHLVPSELSVFVRHAGLVQCRQMDVAAGEVEKASNTIIDGMRHILISAGSLARCQSIADSASDNLVDMFRNDIKAVSELDETGSQINTELAVWVGPAVQTLSQFAVDMRRYSVDIRLAAINAQVHACRVEHGEVLEVMASRLRTVADNSLGIIDQMSGILVDIIRDLNGDLDQSSHAVIAEGEQLRAQIAEVTALLVQVQTDVRCKVTELTSLDEKLTQDTQRTISQTDLHHTVVEPVLQVKSEIETLMESFDIDTSADADDALSSRLNSLRNSYTMEHERAVHDVVARALQKREEPESAQAAEQKANAPLKPETKVADEPPAAPIGAPALGDNVELF